MQKVVPIHQKGQTTVEFALVVGLLLILLFGIIDFSRLLFAYATMSNGVREGARYGIIHPGQDDQIIQRPTLKGTRTAPTNVRSWLRPGATLMSGRPSYPTWNWSPSPRCILNELAG